MITWRYCLKCGSFWAPLPDTWFILRNLSSRGALSLLVNITCSWGSCLSLQGQPPGQLWARDHCLHRPSMELRVDQWELWRAGVCLNSPELSPRLWLTVRPPGGCSDWFLTFNHSVKTGAPCRLVLGQVWRPENTSIPAIRQEVKATIKRRTLRDTYFFFACFNTKNKCEKCP